MTTWMPCRSLLDSMGVGDIRLVHSAVPRGKMTGGERGGCGEASSSTREKGNTQNCNRSGWRWVKKHTKKTPTQLGYARDPPYFLRSRAYADNYSVFRSP